MEETITCENGGSKVSIRKETEGIKGKKSKGFCLVLCICEVSQQNWLRSSRERLCYVGHPKKDPASMFVVCNSEVTEFYFLFHTFAICIPTVGKNHNRYAVFFSAV